MKIVFVAILLFICQFCFSQKIERLKSDKEVLQFVYWLYKQELDSGKNIKDKPLGKYLEDSCKTLYNSLNIKYWDKADFDNNGKMDLLFNGYYYGALSIIAMQFSNDSFAIHHLSIFSRNYCRLPKVIRQNSTYLISLYQSYPDLNSNGWNTIQRTDTLIYKYDNFIEENANIQTHKIEKIEFSVGHCYGPCPVFKLNIDSSGKVAYNAIANNREEGNFSGSITISEYTSIVNALNYIQFPLLKDKYTVSWTDSQTSTTIVTYDGGKTKKIVDYGEIGTFGLSSIYKKIFALRYSTAWKKN